VVFSPDGKRLVSASKDNSVKVWDAQTGQELLTLKHIDNVTSVAYSPDGKRLASASWDNTLKVWNAQTGRSSCPSKGGRA
jgi:WD40 repeat protein